MSETVLTAEEDEYAEEDSGVDFPTKEQIANTENIAELLDRSELARIGMDAKDQIELDDMSRQEWSDACEDGFRLAMQVAENKSYPFDRASNVIYPLITTAALQFAQRCYPAVVPGDRVVQCVVIGDDSGMYEVATDQNGQPVVDPQTGQPQTQMVTPPGIKADRADRVSRHMSWQALFSIEGWEANIDQMLHYLPIAGCAFRKCYYDEKGRRPAVDWIPADKFIINNSAKSIRRAPRYAIEFELYPYEIREKQLRGEYRDVTLESLDVADEQDQRDDQAPRTFYEVYTRLDLDGDGYAEPYVMHVHEDGEILRIEKNFGVTHEDGTIDPYVDCIKYSFIPNPEGGFYDVGFGWLLGPINKTINTTINQLLDAGHWQNAPSGFLGRGIRLGRAGRIELSPNTLKSVDSTGEDLQKNIWIYEHPGPSRVLFSMLQLMIEAGRDISSVQDILQGRTEKNLAPTTISTLVEQGMMTFTSIFKRVHRALKEEFGLIYEINARTLPQHMYAYGDILDNPQAISGEDYVEKGMDIRPITDPKMVSDQVKQARASFLMQMQETGQVQGREATKRMLEAYNIEDPEALLPDEAQEAQVSEQQARMAALQEQMLEQQVRKTAADAIKHETDAGLKPIEQARKVDETRANILNKRTGAIKNVADAEAAEEGQQLERYKRQTESQET